MTTKYGGGEVCRESREGGGEGVWWLMGAWDSWLQTAGLHATHPHLKTESRFWYNWHHGRLFVWTLFRQIVRVFSLNSAIQIYNPSTACADDAAWVSVILIRFDTDLRGLPVPRARRRHKFLWVSDPRLWPLICYLDAKPISPSDDRVVGALKHSWYWFIVTVKISHQPMWSSKSGQCTLW